MELLNERSQVRDVARSWRATYGSGTYRGDKSKSVIGDKLSALDVETATAKDVEEIIGNSSWVCKVKCNECGAETWDAVRVGEPPDHESKTATICVECLRAALRLLDGVAKEQ